MQHAIICVLLHLAPSAVKIPVVGSTGVVDSRRLDIPVDQSAEEAAAEQMAPVTNCECAIDFGGSATKLAFRPVGARNWSDITSVPNAQLWTDPKSVASELVTALQKPGTRIKAMGCSISGNVDQNQTITLSYMMQDQNPGKYGALFRGRGFNLKAAIESCLRPGASVGVVNDGVAAAVGVAFHPNNGTFGSPSWMAKGPILVVTLGTNPAISIVQKRGAGLEVYPPSVTGFSSAQIGTSDGKKALHAPGGCRREDLEGMDVDRKSKRIGRAVAAILSDPEHGYLHKYGDLPTGGVYLMGGLTVKTAIDGSQALSSSLVQQELEANLSELVKQKWREIKKDQNASPPKALVFGSYADQSGVHLNGALMYARHSANVVVHE